VRQPRAGYDALSRPLHSPCGSRPSDTASDLLLYAPIVAVKWRYRVRLNGADHQWGKEPLKEVVGGRRPIPVMGIIKTARGLLSAVVTSSVTIFF